MIYTGSIAVYRQGTDHIIILVLRPFTAAVSRKPVIALSFTMRRRRIIPAAAGNIACQSDRCARYAKGNNDRITAALLQHDRLCKLYRVLSAEIYISLRGRSQGAGIRRLTGQIFINLYFIGGTVGTDIRHIKIHSLQCFRFCAGRSVYRIYIGKLHFAGTVIGTG